MKQIIVVLLALVMLCGCTPAPPVEAPKTFSLSYRGVELTVGMAADAVIARLGDDYTMTEVESCAG